MTSSGSTRRSDLLSFGHSILLAEKARIFRELGGAAWRVRLRGDVMAFVLDASDLSFIEEQRVARLATADAAGRPHIVPVCFTVSRTQLYIAIDAKPKSGNPGDLKRLRNIRERPQVALLLDHYEEDWGRLRWLMIRARAFILEEGDQRQAALQALELRYPQYARMRLASLGLPVIGLEPESVVRWSSSPQSS